MNYKKKMLLLLVPTSIISTYDKSMSPSKIQVTIMKVWLLLRVTTARVITAQGRPSPSLSSVRTAPGT